ncbi:flagellar type III secretion system pore protein FliP [Acidiferrimicrobium sp. IK]|uniref:flagellar type III secretion system pore protein FliP n=1 Tax=Acidiferrimicrobium sp. IK TaxID=2871700 RepID=UPI0021CB5E51|nr:flagellar type III secretion system pore protein FliP [Acidiferrimicrobium sp. IK]MCU4185016.1 flagellar type III secretion system pore protein FliP [Acidiferrimicrobium sp. IK]
MILAVAPAAGSSININLGNSLGKPSDSIIIILALTLLAVAPSLLILLTGFTRIIIVLSLTRQALGLQSTPPNQVLAGLALILSLFIMTPTLNQMNKDALQPYLHGQASLTQAYHSAEVPLKSWMLKQTGTSELSMTTAAIGDSAATPKDASLQAIIPAFMLSQLKSGFIIGFVVFIPFLIIDLVVASVLMSLGMAMLPPTLVSLPFKLLLFVMVNGWVLVTHSLVVSFK